jgi:hypothetical protein
VVPLSDPERLGDPELDLLRQHVRLVHAGERYRDATLPLSELLDWFQIRSQA